MAPPPPDDATATRVAEQKGARMPTFDTPAAISARLEVAVGDLQVRAGDLDTTTVEVHPTDPSRPEDVRMADDTRVELEDGHLVVRTPRLRSWARTDKSGSVDVMVSLPAGSDLHATLGLGDLQCDGRYGACRLRTGLGRMRLEEATSLNAKAGAGDLSVDRVTGHVDVIAGSGEVSIRELGSTGVIKNSNGATWVGTAAGEIRFQVANGNIALERAQAGVVAKTANGDIRVEDVGHGTVVLETQVGDVEVGVPPGTAAWLDVHSRAGKVRNTLDHVDSPDSDAPTVEVRGRTSLGEILVRRPRGTTDVH